jgi:glycosyltransferase involved in cell wall biosynthesis
MTTLKIQPRPIVWDRMLVADLTLITSKRESGPLVARESIACGTPVVSVDVGDVATYLPEQHVVADYDASALADACEAALKERWEIEFTLPQSFSEAYFLERWNQLLEELVA